MLVELLVDAGGTMAEANVARSAPPFDGPALDAARQWKFRPAQVDEQPVPSFAYIAFGFPVPVGIVFPPVPPPVLPVPVPPL